MRYLSVCSGIEAASVAWRPLGWEAVGFSEIEPFPCAVLAYHYPDVKNYGDLTKHEEWDIKPGTVDALIGGTPCQSFSVAGLRKGMADPRGNLALVYLALVNRIRPRWVVWENVPGVLSSNGGRDFGAFLGALGELGYGFAYRVLDAQYWGVAQRRRRVFVVGCLDGWQRAASVLFEREGCTWNYPARRQKGEGIAADIAPCIGASGRGFSRCGETRGQDPVIACNSGVLAMHETGQGFWTQSDIAGSLRAEGENRPSRPSHVIACAVVAPTLSSSGPPFSGTGQSRVEAQAMVVVEQPFEVANCLTRRMHKGINSTVDEGQMPVIVHTLSARYDSTEDGSGRGLPLVPAYCFEPGIAKREGGNNRFSEEVAPTLRRDMGDNQPAVASAFGVRRLTPIECERLQGFPDNWTAINYRGKPAADGPRYKAIGNSMAVPVMRWIGERIQMTEDCR